MSVSRLDQLYRRLLLTKFFTRGWGKPDNLKRLFDFRKILSNRETCQHLVSADYPIHIDKEYKDGDCLMIEGHFTSPFVHHLPGIMPKEVETASFQMILPLQWRHSNLKPVCIHLAGTGDHYFWRRRILTARPLLKEAGLASILLENPYYGTRKPKHQLRSSLHNVSDLFVMGGALVLESLALLHWCEREGWGPLGLSGVSMGGHMASLAATNWTKPIALIPCLSWSTASCVFTQGVMSGAIPWKTLQDQFFENSVYQDEIRKLIISPEDNRKAYHMGQQFVKDYSKDITRMESIHQHVQQQQQSQTSSDKEKQQQQHQTSTNKERQQQRQTSSNEDQKHKHQTSMDEKVRSFDPAEMSGMKPSLNKNFQNQTSQLLQFQNSSSNNEAVGTFNNGLDSNFNQKGVEVGSSPLTPVEYLSRVIKQRALNEVEETPVISQRNGTIDSILSVVSSTISAPAVGAVSSSTVQMSAPAVGAFSSATVQMSAPAVGAVSSSTVQMSAPAVGAVSSSTVQMSTQSRQLSMAQSASLQQQQHSFNHLPLPSSGLSSSVSVSDVARLQKINIGPKSKQSSVSTGSVLNRGSRLALKDAMSKAKLVTSHPPSFLSSSSSNDEQMKDLQQEALDFMRGVMDECTHLGNFSMPVDPELIIIVSARQDAYVPKEGVIGLDQLWPGCEVRFVDQGHVGAVLFNQSFFRKAIVDAFEKQIMKYYQQSPGSEPSCQRPAESVR